MIEGDTLYIVLSHFICLCIQLFVNYKCICKFLSVQGTLFIFGMYIAWVKWRFQNKSAILKMSKQVVRQEKKTIHG